MSAQVLSVWWNVEVSSDQGVDVMEKGLCCCVDEGPMHFHGCFKDLHSKLL